MNDLLIRHRLILIARIFLVSGLLTFLIAFLLPAMLSYAYVAEVTVDDSQVDFESEPVDVDLTAVVSGTTLDEQGVALLPIGSWREWLTDTITSTDQTQPFPARGIQDLMAVAHEGKIYVVGGYNTYSSSYLTNTYSATIIANSTWISEGVSDWITQSTATGLLGRAAGAAVISQTGDADRAYLYVIGGYGGSPEGLLDSVYSATVNNSTGQVSSWTRVLSLPTTLQYHSAVLYNGIIYAIGGEKPTLSRDVYTAAIQSDGSLTSPFAESWGIITNSLPLPRTQGAAVLVEGPVSTTIYYMGGLSNTVTNTIYYCDILPGGVLSPWYTSTASLDNPLFGHGAIASQGQIVLVGGRISLAGAVTSTTQGAAPDESNAEARLSGPPYWKWGPPLPSGRTQSGVVAYGDKVFAIGGGDSSWNSHNEVYHTTFVTCTSDCKYSPVGLYVSRVFSSADYVSGSVGGMFWDARVPISSGMVLYYHTATTPSALESADWITMGASLVTGTYTYNFEPAEHSPFYVQYKAVLTSATPYQNTPFLDKIGFLQEEGNPDLVITKTASAAQVVPGQIFTYSISLVYTNTWSGPFTATVTETIPLSTTCLDSSWTAAGSAPDGRSIYVRQVYLPTSTTGTLLPLDITLQTTTTVPSGYLGLWLTNTVEAGYSLTDTLNPVITDPTPINNIYTYTVVFTNSTPTIAIAKGAAPPPGSTVYRDGQIVYVLTYTVSGGGSDLLITDVVNTAVFSNVLPGPNGTYSNGVVTFTLNSASGVGTVYFTAVVGSYAVTGTVYNSATIASPITGTTTSNTITHTIAATPTAPVLGITKGSSPPHGSTVYTGDRIVYYLTYTVSGGDASALRITDTVDTSIFSGVDPGPDGSYSAGTVTYGPLSAASGTTASVVFTATVRSSGVVSGSTVSNYATVGAAMTDTTTSNTITHTIIYSGSGPTTLEISKTVDYVVVDQNIQQFRYHVYIKNTGSAPALNVLLTDTLPVGIGDRSCYYQPNTVAVVCGQPVRTVWPGDTIAAGETSYLRVIVSTTLPITDQSTLTNSDFLATASNVSGVVTGAPVSVIVNAPAWGISKDGPTAVDAGSSITYTIRITNTGHLTTFYPYILTDLLPSYTTFGSCDPTGCASGGGVVTWTFAPPLYIGSGLTNTLYLVVASPLTNGLVITNTCAVSGTDVIPNGFCNPFTTTVHSSPILTITKKGLPEPVDAGGVLTYTITVENDDTANGVALYPVVTDTVPDNAVFLAATGGLAVSTPPVSGTGTITWELPALWPGQSAVVTVTVAITSPLPNGTVITNQVTVTDADALIPATAIATNTVRSSPYITMSKTVTPNLVMPGGTVTYTIVMTNLGNASAENALVTDTLPFTFGSMVEGPTPAYLPPEVVWTTTITGRSLYAESGPPLTLTFTATASLVPGVYSNTVTVTTGISSFVVGPTAPVTVVLPNLLVTKTAPITVPAGSLLTYTLSYTNDSIAPAYGAVITDETPPYTVFFTATGGTGVITAPTVGGTGPITWELGTVWPQTGGVVTMVVSVTSPLTNGTIITNYAWITGTAGISDSSVATTTVVASPLLVAFKEAVPPNGSFVSPGSAITYTVTITNLGNGNALYPVINDLVPTYTQYVPGSIGGSPYLGYDDSGRVLSYTLAAVPGGGGVITFTFAVTVQTPLTNGTVITNDAWAWATDTAVTYTNHVTHVVVSTPTLTVGKAAEPPHGSTVRPGDTITYTVTVTNTGSDAAANLVITDPLPLYTSYVTGSASGSPGGSAGSGDPLTYTLPILPGGGVLTFTFAVTVTTPLTNGTIISNSAEVYGGQLSGGWTGITSTNPVTHLVQSSAAFSVTKVADPPHGSDVSPGATITYTVILTNNGDGYAVAPSITDTVPTYTNYLIGSLDGTPGYGWTNWPDPLAIGWPSLAGNGGVLTFTFKVIVTTPLTNGTIISNFAQAVAVDAPISYTNEVTHRVVSTASLQVLKIATPPHGSDIAPGSYVTYTIIVTNAGSDYATNPVITDPVPTYTSYVVGSASGTPGGSWGYDSAAPPTLTYTIGSLAGGGQAITFTFAVTANSPLTDGTIITDVALVGADLLAITTTNEVTHRVISRADVEVAKTAEPPHGSAVRPGDTITYTVTVSNTGTTPLSNLLITDAVPANTGYVAGSLSGSSATTYDGGPLSMTVGSLAPFATPITFTFRVTVNLLTPGGTIIANSAWITTAQTGITYTNSVTHVVVSTATLQLSKSASPPGGSNVSPGSTITYTITISNVGDAIASSVYVTDLLPSQVNYLPGSASPALFSTNPPAWYLSSLSPLSGPITFTLRVTVTKPMTNGIIITNLAQASAGNAAITTSNDVTHVVASSVALTATKRAAPSPGSVVQSGSTITYTIVITASGDGYATGMTITDLLDSNLTYVTGSASPAQTSGPNPLVWDGSRSLGGGSVLSITFGATVNTGLPDGTIISNTAWISSAQTTAQSTNLVTHSIVTRQPVITITKSAQPRHGSTVSHGGTIVYTLRLTNTGDYTATDVLLTDTIPTNTSYADSVTVSPTGGSWNYFTPPSTLTYTVPSLGPGKSITVTFAVTASTTYTGTVTNSALVSSKETAITGSQEITHRIYSLPAGDVYMPIIFNNYVTLPDLLPVSLEITPSSAEAGTPVSIVVTVHNSSTVTSGGFWVDLYINPSATPTVNQRWNDLNSAEGIAWSVPSLAPGATVTLVSTCSDGATYPTPPCYGSQYSRWPGYFVSSSPRTIYVLVDSWGSSDVWGGVQECLTSGCSEEQNNLWGPTTMSALGAEEEKGIEPSVQQQEIAPRPLHRQKQ